MYQEFNIFHKTSASSGQMGGGGRITGGPEGNEGSQHDRKCGGGGPLNFRPGFLDPNLDPGIWCGGGKNMFHGRAFDSMILSLFPEDLKELSLSSVKIRFSFLFS